MTPSCTSMAQGTIRAPWRCSLINMSDIAKMASNGLKLGQSADQKPTKRRGWTGGYVAQVRCQRSPVPPQLPTYDILRAFVTQGQITCPPHHSPAPWGPPTADAGPHGSPIIEATPYRMCQPLPNGRPALPGGVLGVAQHSCQTTVATLPPFPSGRGGMLNIRPSISWVCTTPLRPRGAQHLRHTYLQVIVCRMPCPGETPHRDHLRGQRHTILLPSLQLLHRTRPHVFERPLAHVLSDTQEIQSKAVQPITQAL